MELTNDITNIEKLNAFIDFIKINKKHKPKPVIKATYENVCLICDELKSVRELVYNVRYNEAKELFFKNKDSIKISCFELMEHDFRENSHTNILRYLLDFRYSGDLGIEIFQKILEKLDTNEARIIISKIESSTYNVEREKSTGNGRMDLFIVDNENEFLVMIENKVLSSIIEKGYVDGADEEVNERQMRTQLTNYKDYIQEQYKNYTKLLILLSYKKQVIIDKDFIYVDYSFLLEVLLSVNSQDNILNEYKILLQSLLESKINKIGILEFSHSVFNNKQNKKISLSQIESIKNIFYE